MSDFDLSFSRTRKKDYTRDQFTAEVRQLVFAMWPLMTPTKWDRLKGFLLPFCKYGHGCLATTEETAEKVVVAVRLFHAEGVS